MLSESWLKGPENPKVRDITIGDALREAAAAAPEQVALIAGTPDQAQRRSWTYHELLAEAEQTAHALLSRFQLGERVAVWAPNIPEWVIMEYGCALAGLILVTVNPSYQPPELSYVLQQSGSVGIFLLPEHRGNPMLRHLESIRHECPTLREVVPFTEWREFLATGSPQKLPPVTPDDACMIQYTSGTTGFPKGALLHHRGLVNNGSHTMAIAGLEPNAATMGVMPLFHTSGCVLAVLGALSLRAKLVLVEFFEPGLVLELVESYRAVTLPGVPTMHIALLEHPTFENRDLSSLRAIFSGGATVPAALVRRLESTLKAPFVIVFGQTECSPVACMTRPSDSIEDKAETVGLPMPNVEVKVIDPETGRVQPVGVLGEFLTRGYHVMHEYFENPEATEKTVDENGWLHSGDLVVMDERGYCTVEGRLKDMIIRGGENIYPREIEELLFKHETVAEVAVVGLPDHRMGEEIAAFIRAEPGQTLSREELFGYCREYLSPQKTPRYWIQVATYPLTGSGKIQKFALREAWIQGNYAHALIE